jgi:C-terminal processing protease CtpA/Prc
VLPPFLWQWVGEQLVVTQVPDSIRARYPALRPGAVVQSIDGRSVDAAWRDVATRISSPTPQWARTRALNELARGTPGSILHLDIAGESAPTRIDLLRGLWSPQLEEKRPDRIAPLRPGIWYVDVSRLQTDDLAAAADSLAAARGVIFDMRGYPGTAEAWKVLRYTASDTLHSAHWLIPRVTKPDHVDMVFDTSGWPVVPLAPHFGGRIAFLTDGRAISAAETFMGIVEAYHLGAIVGGPTAGTNGNVNPFVLPGDYTVRWTGMKVLKHDGSRHHGVGVQPTIPVSPTVAGLAAGRDEVLERGLQVVSSP